MSHSSPSPDIMHGALPRRDVVTTGGAPAAAEGGEHARQRRQRPARGFTLVELIITVVIVGILAGIGFPAFQEFTQSAAARRAVDDLASGFLSARTLAVSNGVDIKICAVSGGACSASVADWKNAWAVFEDCDGDNVIDDDASSVACTPANSNVSANGPERVYARGDTSDSNWSITDDNGAAGPTVFNFRPSGRVDVAVSPGWPVTFEIHGASQSKKNRLIVSRLGHVCVEIRESGGCG